MHLVFQERPGGHHCAHGRQARALLNTRTRTYESSYTSSMQARTPADAGRQARTHARTLSTPTHARTQHRQLQAPSPQGTQTYMRAYTQADRQRTETPTQTNMLAHTNRHAGTQTGTHASLGAACRTHLRAHFARKRARTHTRTGTHRKALTREAGAHAHRQEGTEQALVLFPVALVLLNIFGRRFGAAVVAMSATGPAPVNGSHWWSK